MHFSKLGPSRRQGQMGSQLDSFSGTGIRVMQEFFDLGKMPLGVNEMSIIILPKKDGSKLLTDFRPISLCNVIYKVISKCLVNRLRPLL
jgi:hypothetical protein